MSIAAAHGAGNEKTTFQPKPVTDYAHRMTSEKVTIAAEPFVTDDQAHEAFGKLNPFRHGILPVLLVIRNEGTQPIRVDRMKATYALPDRSQVDATPARDVRFLNGVNQPKTIPGPPGKIKVGRSKNPLDEWEIEGRAFSAKMILPGETASGFVYFQTSIDSAAASVLLTGLENATTGKELYYFEIPVSGK